MLYAVKITVGALTAAAGAAAPVVAPVTWDVGWILTAIGMICAGLAVVVRTIWSAATERQSVLESQKSVAQELMQLHTKFDQREYVAARWRTQYDRRMDKIDRRITRVETMMSCTSTDPQLLADILRDRSQDDDTPPAGTLGGP